MQTLTLYELSGKDDRRFSPFCWRVRLALAHKKLQSRTVPVRYTDKSSIAFTGQDRVPVLVDGDKVVCDSWAIACHLEDQYPDRPSLFGGMIGRELSRFVDLWGTRSVFPHIVRLVLVDAIDHLDDEDAAYVRKTREHQLGVDLESLREQRPRNIGPFHESLVPLRSVVRRQPFLGGAQPTYADYSVFSLFQWARMISPYRLLEQDDPVFGWRRRVLDLHDGLAAKAPNYDI